MHQPVDSSDGHLEHCIGAGLRVPLLLFGGATPDETLCRADVALYRAKTAGESAISFFDDAMDQQMRKCNVLEHELRLALADHAIESFFWQLLDLTTKDDWLRSVSALDACVRGERHHRTRTLSCY